MDTQEQFAVFGLCLIIGFLGGILYEPFSFVRLLFGCRVGKNKIIGAGLDIAFCVGFTLFSTAMAFALRFPSFRLYMCVGYGLGGIIYLKSLHRILAFFQNLCYNKVTQWIKKAKNRKKLLKKEVGKGL